MPDLLSQEEADVLDIYGREVLRWLQENSFFVDGKFTYETEPHKEQLRWVEFQSAIRIAEGQVNASKQCIRDSIDSIERMHAATMNAIKAVYKSVDAYKENRPKAQLYVHDFTPQPRRPSLYHDVIDLSLYNHRRKRALS